MKTLFVNIICLLLCQVLYCCQGNSDNKKGEQLSSNKNEDTLSRGVNTVNPRNDSSMSTINKEDCCPKTNKRANKALDSINVIRLNEQYNGETIELYDSNGSIWKSFEVTDELLDSAIGPYTVKEDDRILIFRVTGRKNGYYEVASGHDYKRRSYIRPHCCYFSYETWAKHILTAFAVDFSPEKNIIRSIPSSRGQALPFDSSLFYHPVKVQGDWLKIIDDNDKEGWIRWRDKSGKMIVEIYYEA